MRARLALGEGKQTITVATEPFHSRQGQWTTLSVNESTVTVSDEGRRTIIAFLQSVPDTPTD